MLELVYDKTFGQMKLNKAKGNYNDTEVSANIF